VGATSGPAGGYRLGAGANLPPLLLDDEAVAVAVGLRTAANGTVAGIEETSVRALAKLEHVLPSRLRHRVAALQAATVPLATAGPAVDPSALVLIASACRDLERLRFAYRDRDGNGTTRTVEPHRLVHTGRRWYLVARDVERDDWRTFCVDRIGTPLATGRHFNAQDPPDAATYVARAVSTQPYRYHCRVRLQAAATVIAQRVPPTVALVEAVDANSCVLTTGSASLDALAAHLMLLGTDFAVLEPPEPIDHIRALADRLNRAAPRVQGWLHDWSRRALPHQPGHNGDADAPLTLARSPYSPGHHRQRPGGQCMAEWIEQQSSAVPVPAEARVTRGPDATLRDLLDVLGVGQSVQVGQAMLTLLSFERYVDGFLAQFRVLQTYEPPRTFLDLGLPDLVCEAGDDRGGSYTPWPHGGSGGGGGRGPLQWRIAYRYAPALDSAARELRVTIRELRWMATSRRASHQPPPRWSPGRGRSWCPFRPLAGPLTTEHDAREGRRVQLPTIQPCTRSRTRTFSSCALKPSRWAVIRPPGQPAADLSAPPAPRGSARPCAALG